MPPPSDRRPAFAAATRPLTRRRVLAGGVALAGLLAAPALPRLCDAARLVPPRFAENPFTLGVASGEPTATGVVLWTRLAPEPLVGDTISAAAVPVEWQVAENESFSRIVQSGVEPARWEEAHSVHVEVDGLTPNRWYWYRFRVGDAVSPIGRTRTTPAPDAPAGRLTLAVASCQDWQAGYYTAYRRLIEEEHDLVLFLGDYIYEYAAAEATRVRAHDGPEPTTLAGYRNRYALYKTDPALQAAHAALPWIVAPDDHEVVNDYAGSGDGAGTPTEAFLARRAAAYQAYWEHQPLRRAQKPVGPDMPLYRRFAWGDLVALNVLDTRQYRTPQPCGGGLRTRCDEAFSERATLLGPEQERWLADGLTASRARWNVLGQQIMVGQFRAGFGASALFNLDQWDGYVAARQRLLRLLADRAPRNPIVLSGDVHSSWVHDLKLDFDNPSSPTVGVEFVGMSITSEFPQNLLNPVSAAVLLNPHIKFFDGLAHGFLRCEITPERWRTEYRGLATTLSLDAPCATIASFEVEDGRAGVRRV